MRVTLGVALLCTLAMAWIDSPVTLALLVCATVLAYGCIWVPAMANLSDHAERLGLGQEAAFALQSLWAPAHVAGSFLVGGALAQSIGRPATFMALAGLCLTTLLSLASNEQEPIPC
jgi:hypothetical protein